MTSFLFLEIILAILVARENPATFRASADDFLTPSEKSQLEREENIENRIRIYESASSRIHRSIRGLVERQEFQSFSEQLKAWPGILTEAFRDIDQNIRRKKKSKNLIRFEIHLRKALADLRDLKLQVPLEYQDEFETALDRVDGVRKRLVEILFQS